MSKILMNLTMPIIVEEIENVLEFDPYYSESPVSTIPDLRQKLVSYTLNHVRSRYRSIDLNDQTIAHLRSQPSSLEEHLQIEAVVRQGIQQLTQQTSNRLTSRRSQPALDQPSTFVAC